MIVQDRDLRTGAPVWSEYVRPRIPYAPLTHSIDTDITIIGAGISGAMMAEAVSGRGMDVVIVDKRKPLSGSTSASSAISLFFTFQQSPSNLDWPSKDNDFSSNTILEDLLKSERLWGTFGGILKDTPSWHSQRCKSNI